MPHVIDDTDVLDYTTPSPTCDEIQVRALALSPSRRGRSHRFAALRNFFISLRWVRTHQEPHGVGDIRQFELPMDILARQHPDLYLRSMVGTG
jgi:hypothetical protein